ncbi:ABC transporter substrate-binding protein [Ancylobacter defluvii]|uniref:4,5-dihydroxyphthalate decarboxylase n=1 Tax=Ancylobacter defluvii TaxID=1282440 RepID=A0A9W6NCG8_9HYPH|nr:ABC transporter substrate-binding protein [Ancylobacter defluvii]MBS7586364.1 ABC transporter substrate-binding protein [Ancylobacter defluvii]GLK85645.1 4,5-dihydroxyphthalate decarboxylase [Ancylobacter defluvii]
MSGVQISPAEVLTIGCGAYDRTWPLIAGVIRPPGYRLDWAILPPEEVFLRGMLGGEFDITEMSLSTYSLLRSRGTCRYVGLPIFVSRKFRHSAIYIRADADIARPEDLRGRRIGMPEYQLTANVWVRGLLSDEYGVSADSVHWMIGGIDAPGREEKVPIDLPTRFTVTRLGAGETLWQMLLEGRVDAIIAPRAPQAFAQGHPAIRRLFADVPGAERDYYRRTGLFPLMHVIGVRQDVMERHVGLPAALSEAFSAAKAFAAGELHQYAYDAAMLPWQEASLRETEATMGADYWPYGLEPNRMAIEAFARYQFEQGIVERVQSASDIFPID